MIQPTPTPLFPAPERPEEEQIRGILTVTIDGQKRAVPTLKRVHSREWKQQVTRTIASIDLPDTDDIELLVRTATLTDDIIFELVIAYDRTNALGGREYLDEHADDRDIHEAFEVMLRAASPKVDDPVAGFANQISAYLALAWARLVKARADRSASERSIPGSPESTAGTRTPSTSDSATSSSSSSGATDKRPRRERRAKPST